MSPELRLTDDLPTCLKCGHARTRADVGPDFSCPKCGAVYAKMQALAAERERQGEQARKATRRAEILAESDRKLGARLAQDAQTEEPLRLAAHGGYLLLLVPLLVTQLAAVALAYNWRSATRDSWLDDHFTWQIRTFWYVFAIALLLVPIALVGAASVLGLIVFGAKAPFDVGSGIMGSIKWWLAIVVAASALLAGRSLWGWFRLATGSPP